MAFSFHYFLLLSSLLFIQISLTSAKTSSHPKALLLRVSKDPSTNQYITQINRNTPLAPIKLTIDLGGRILWVYCAKGYITSGDEFVRCNTTFCKLSDSNSCGMSCGFVPKPECIDHLCFHDYFNPVNNDANLGPLSLDFLSFETTNGMNPGISVSVPNFLFTCAGFDDSIYGLAQGVNGLAGFGMYNISVPSQLSSSFGLQKKFSICLSSSQQSNGVIFFGNGPYQTLPNHIISQALSYTPVLINPFGVGTSSSLNLPSTEYFIGVKSVKVNGKKVKIDKKLLNITEQGTGGTKISTVDPYTVLESSIYKAVTKAFVKAMKKVPRVNSVAPFGLCFDAKHIGSTRVGPAVPPIDLVLQNNETVWRIWGGNSMVLVKDTALCLGFVDGGVGIRSSIVIGGYQLEDNYLEFDYGSKKIGFSGSLLSHSTTCANFNFTSTS